MKSFPSVFSKALFVLVGGTFATQGCTARKYPDSEPESIFKKGPKLEVGKEYPEPDEDKKIQEIVDISLELMRKHEPKDGVRRRDVHSKSHGCLRGFFKIESKLNPEHRVGVFQEGKVYPAWFRISNGAPGVGKDSERQTSRGFAMKLMEVSGAQLLDEEKNTQDFLLVNGKRFFIQDLDTYIKFLRESNNERSLVSFLEINPLKWPQKAQELLALIERTQLKIANPVEVPYFSAVPYRLGDNSTATKYRITPCTKQPEQVRPKDPADDYLRIAMKDTMSRGDVCYNFELLVQVNAEKQPIENPMVEWKPEDTGAVKVAQIHIPKQDFDTSTNAKICESLSFHPWHSLAEHQPLGNMNRTRKVVYTALAKARKSDNSDPYLEPTPDAEFKNLAR